MNSISFGRPGISASIVVFGKILLALNQFVSYFILTRVVRPNELGIYYLILTSINIFFFFLITPVTHWLTREGLNYYEQEKFWGLFLRLILYSISISIFASLILLTINHWHIIGGIAQPVLLVGLFMPLYLMCFSIVYIVTSSFTLFDKRIEAAFVSALGVWMQLSGIVLAVLLVENLGTNIFYGAVSGYIIAAIISLFYIWLKFGIGKSTKVHLPLRDMWVFCMPMAIQGLLGWGQSQGFRFSLARQAGEESVGLFQAAYSAGATPILLFDTIFLQFYVPYFMRDLTDNQGNTLTNSDATSQFLRYHLPILLPVLAISIGFAPSVMRLLAGQEYVSVANYSIWGALAEGLRLIGTAAWWGFIALRQTRYLSIAMFIAAIVSIVGTWMLAGTYPLNGPGFALSMAGVLSTIYLFVQIQKKVSLYISGVQILNSVFVSIILLVVTVVFQVIWQNKTPIDNLIEITVGLLVGFIAIQKPVRGLLTRLS